MNDGLGLEALLLGCRLSQPDAGEFWVGEDRRRQDRIVRRGAFARVEHVLDGDPCLVLGYRREQRLAVDVAGGPDTGDVGA